MPIAVQWWATWYPGAEPGGGSYIAQRMLASKSEKDALGAVLFFNVAHYVLRPWPWILVGLCSLLVYPQLSDIQAAFPNLDPSMLGHDIAYPAMLKFLPVGFIGLMVGGLIAANSSTILTHLNWGASYLVHDFYRASSVRAHPRRTTCSWAASPRGPVPRDRPAWCTCSIRAKDSFDIILQIGAGTGLLYLLRWFWWRINAWCEVAAMVSSFGVSVILLLLKKQGLFVPGTHIALLLTIAVTTVCWVLTAFLAPPTDRATLIAFYRRVRPFGPGWRAIRAQTRAASCKASPPSPPASAEATAKTRDGPPRSPRSADRSANTPPHPSPAPSMHRRSRKTAGPTPSPYLPARPGTRSNLRRDHTAGKSTCVPRHPGRWPHGDQPRDALDRAAPNGRSGPPSPFAPANLPASSWAAAAPAVAPVRWLRPASHTPRPFSSKARSSAQSATPAGFLSPPEAGSRSFAESAPRG
jgi:hypothetical protein